MSLLYRVKFKIVENGKTYEGTRVVEQPVDEYMKHINRTYLDASYVYLELVDTFEEVISESTESLIILGMKMDWI